MLERTARHAVLATPGPGHPAWMTALVLAAVLVAGGCPGPADDDAAADDDGADDDSGDDDTAGDDDGAGDDDSGDDDAGCPDPLSLPDVYVTPDPLVPGGSATIRYGGPLADRDNLTVHYGFDGWNQVPGVGPMLEETASGNTDYYLEAEMTPVVDGFEVTIALPTDGHALHFVFYTVEDEVETWDNRGGRDYHWSIAFPYLGPYLTWGDAAGPDDGVVVHYETALPCLGAVEYGTTPALGSWACGGETDTLHHIPLTGLPHDTEIHYRVHDSAGHGSAIHRFRTPPLGGGQLRFAVLADAQDHGDGLRWGDVAAHLHATHDVDLLLAPGDLANNDKPGLWWTFFHLGGELLASHVIVPAPGNHDTPGNGSDADTSSFDRYFAPPTASGSPSHYRLDVGPAALLLLSSEIVDEPGPWSDQQVWLAQQLDDLAGGAVPWVFAAWHVAPFNAGERHHTQMDDVRPLIAGFDGVVDWAFAGHEHLYQRMVPLHEDGQAAPSGLYGPGPDDGVGYLVLPPAGAWPNEELVAHDGVYAAYRDWVAHPAVAPGVDTVPSEVGYAIVDLDGGAIAIDVWGLGTIETPWTPWIRDSVSYTK